MKEIGIWIAVALIGAIGVLAIILGGGESSPQLAPNFTLRSLDGADVSLAEFLGSVVILDFWATWCKPCTTTFPELHALVEEYEDRGVILLVVSLDKRERNARDHLVTNGFATGNVLWESRDASRAVKALYGVSGIPRTFLIDRSGYIRFSGHPTRLTPEEIDPWL